MHRSTKLLHICTLIFITIKPFLMSSQPAGRLRLKNGARQARLFIQAFFNWRMRVNGFAKRINPGNWFNDFRNIEITLEELSESKKNAATPIPATRHDPDSFLANTPPPSAN